MFRELLDCCTDVPAPMFGALDRPPEKPAAMKPIPVVTSVMPSQSRVLHPAVETGADCAAATAAEEQAMWAMRLRIELERDRVDPPERALKTGAGPSVVASGISEALISTAAGLFVAIPAVFAYNYFLKRARRLSIELERVSTLLIHISRR